MKIEGGAKRGRGAGPRGVCLGWAGPEFWRAGPGGVVMAIGSTSAEDDVHS